MENSDVRRSRHSLTEPSPDVTPVATNDQPSEKVIEDSPDYDGLIDKEHADLKTGHSVEAQFFDRHEVAQPGEMGEENRTYDETERRRRKYEAFFPIGKTAFMSFLFIADIVMDIILAHHYRLSGDDRYFYFTVVCIVVPSVIMSIVDVCFLYVDKKSGKCVTFKRWIIGLVCLGRQWRAVSYMKHLFKDKNAPDTHTSSKHRKRHLEIKRDNSILDITNAFTDLMPQLILQFYIFYKSGLELNLTACKIIVSWVDIGLTYAFNYKTLREAESDRLQPDVSHIGFFCYFLANLAALAVRVSCLVGLMICSSVYIGIAVLVVNFFIILGFIRFYVKPKLEGLVGETNTIVKGFYYVLLSYIMCFCFVNLKSPTCCKLIGFYSMLYTQSFIMATIYFCKCSTEYCYLPLFVAGVGIVVHFVLLLLYYKLFHPTIGAFRSVSENQAHNNSGSM